jgi:hypothetical protein
MNTISDTLVEKIRKLLALASELNDSREQAEEAMKKAKALAIQHSIDLASIEVFESKKNEEPIVKNDETILGQRMSVCQKFISWLLEEHFNVKIVYSHKFSDDYRLLKKLVIIGRKSDIEIAIYIQSYLNQEFMRLWHQYQQTNPNVQVKDRNSFFWGLYDGLRAKLEEGKKEAEQNGFDILSATKTADEIKQVQNCLALTVTTHKEKLNQSVKEFFPKLRKSYSYTSFNHSESARTAGFNKGKQISLRRGIGSGNQAQLQ